MNILLHSEFPRYHIRNNNSHNETNGKGTSEVIRPHSHYILIESSLASCNLKNGFRYFVPQVIRNNNQFSTP